MSRENEGVVYRGWVACTAEAMRPKGSRRSAFGVLAYL